MYITVICLMLFDPAQHIYHQILISIDKNSLHIIYVFVM